MYIPKRHPQQAFRYSPPLWSPQKPHSHYSKRELAHYINDSRPSPASPASPSSTAPSVTSRRASIATTPGIQDITSAALDIDDVHLATPQPRRYSYPGDGGLSTTNTFGPRVLDHTLHSDASFYDAVKSLQLLSSQISAIRSELAALQQDLVQTVDVCEANLSHVQNCLEPVHRTASQARTVENAAEYSKTIAQDAKAGILKAQQRSDDTSIRSVSAKMDKLLTEIHEMRYEMLRNEGQKADEFNRRKSIAGDCS